MGATLSTGGWRLPTIAELVTIVERDNVIPAINTAIFPNTSSSSFWSASAYANDSGDAWFVNFGDGGDDSNGTAGRYYVRLVRGGQSLGSSSTAADCLFNWAEKSYPAYFSPAGGKSQTLDVYTYRQYTGNTYLAVSSKDSHVWAILGGSIMDAGPASQWYATAGCQ